MVGKISTLKGQKMTDGLLVKIFRLLFPYIDQPVREEVAQVTKVTQVYHIPEDPSLDGQHYGYEIKLLFRNFRFTAVTRVNNCDLKEGSNYVIQYQENRNPKKKRIKIRVIGGYKVFLGGKGDTSE
jgi:hypothetical protein